MQTAGVLEIKNLRPLDGFVPEAARKTGVLPLFWAGSGLELLFTGSELTVCFEADFTVYEPWITMELNGAPLLRMPLNRGRSEVCLFRGMSVGVPKHIRIFKETQPMTDDPRQRLDAVEIIWGDGEFLPLPKFDMQLEFVGDSLTTGEGIVGALEETDWISALVSGSRTWARMAASRLNAASCAVSQSGWGVCSGWDGDLTHVLPAWYEKTVLLRERDVDAVIVNLGTNDTAAVQSGFITTQDFERAALKFAQTLRRCHPDAKLVWAYGMLGDFLRPQLERVLGQFDGACYLPLPPMTEETVGSRQHPGPLCHQAAAQATVDFLKKIL